MKIWNWFEIYVRERRLKQKNKEEKNGIRERSLELLAKYVQKKIEE